METLLIATGRRRFGSGSVVDCTILHSASGVSGIILASCGVAERGVFYTSIVYRASAVCSMAGV